MIQSPQPRISHFLRIIGGVAVAALVTASGSVWADELLDKAKLRFGIVVSPADSEVSSPLAQIGRELFWDERISVGQKTSCGSCHLPDHGGADPRRFSERANGELTKRNSQAVFNATLQSNLRWLADRKSAVDQAIHSLTGSIGHNSPESVEARIRELGYENWAMKSSGSR